jgi:hypothetical protein
MTLKKYLLIIWILLITQILPGKEYTKTLSEKLVISSYGWIRIDNKYGNITANSWDKDYAKVELEIIINSKKDKKAKKLINMLELNIKKLEDGIAIIPYETDSIDIIKNEFKGSIEYNYYLNCSPNTSLTLTNNFGDLEVNSFKSKVFAHNNNGDTRASNHEYISIKNSFGEVTVSDVVGFAIIKNSNGDIVIRDSQDVLNVLNGFGDVDLANCSGIITVGGNNGTFKIEGIKNGRLKGSNHFGESIISSIEGNVNWDIQNGSLTISKISGNIKSKAKFSEIMAKNIEGDCEIDSKNGEVSVQELTGSLELNNSFGSNYIDSIGKETEINSQNGKIILSNARGPITINNTFANTILSSVNPRIRIESANGMVKISDLLNSEIEINIANNFGMVDVEVPEKYKGAFDLSTSHGKIYIGNELKDRNNFVEEGKTEEYIKIKNNNGDIKIR